MLKIPLTENDIVNVKDDYALVMDIWHELERLANTFTQECTDIQNNFKMRSEKMDKDHTSQKGRLNSDHTQQISKLDYEKSNTLEQWENKFKNNQRTTNQKKENARQANQHARESSEQYKADMMAQINKRKNQLMECLQVINRAESTISAKRYQKIAKPSTKPIDIVASSLDQLMLQNPKLMAEEINELNSKLIKKLIHPNLLKNKCIEFYSYKLKAKELYDKEIVEQDNILPGCDQKVASMIEEASRRYQNELNNLNKDAEKEKQAYLRYVLELEDQFENKRKILLQDHAKENEQLARRQQNEKETIQKKRQEDLINALKKYQTDQLHNLPPAVLKKYVDSLMARKITSSRGFKCATEEPWNVTVGYVYFKFEQFLENKLVKQFMAQNYGFILKGGAFVLPYTISINEKLALCYKYDNRGVEQAKSDMQTLCMNTFLATPPNKMRFHFIDPLKSGQSFAIFKHFEEDNSSGYNVIMGGIQTEASSVEQQLQIVVDHIKTMQVNTFKGQYKNIREYNAANTLNPQPYNIVGIMDFPAGFTTKSIELLGQVVATGKDCGVYVILMANEEQLLNLEPKLRGQVDSITNMCNTFSFRQPGYANISDRTQGENIRYMIDKPIPINEIVNIAPIMKKGIKDAGRIVIEYENISPNPNTYLKYNTDQGIDIPIGLSGASDIQSLRLGEPGSQSVHALICGQIGSGKSRLLHAIITGALLKYPKEELQIYLIDFKSGTEFKIYADYNLPNFKVIAIESEQEFGLSVLRDIKRESERRAQIFNNCTVSDITTYNKSPGVERYGRLPRVLIVIDEFHMLFSNANQAVANEASQIMDGILRLDRSFGFHIVLCSQSIRGMSAISEPAMAQIAVRIALKCPKEDADIVLGKGSDAIAQIEENDAGSAIYVPAFSSPKVNNKFRVGFLSNEKHSQLLNMLDTFYNQKGIKTDARILVSDVSDSRNSVFQRYCSDGEIIAKDRVIHLGEPLKVDANLEVRFDSAPANNMLLVGKNSQKAQNLLLFATLDLVLQKVNQIRSKRPPIEINVINYCDGANSVLDDRLQDLGLSVPQFVNYYDGASASLGIEDAYNHFVSKQPGSPDEWLIISNLELASELQSSSVYGSYRENANRFEEMLKEGPKRGLFIIAWCSDPALFKAKFSNTFDYFGKRVVFNVGKEDAAQLADIIDDESINKNNAYIYQNGKGKEKFRPYSTPMEKWMRYLCDEKLDKEQA